MIGRTVRQYEIVDRLGRGGMGVVYKARDTVLDRMVALKFLTPGLDPDPGQRERFLQEARSASSLNHPNICTIYETGMSDDGQMFISMAYYEGRTLRTIISELAGPLPVDQSLKIATDIADALAVAHGTGIVHRDIKPGNILVTNRGRTILLDFGLAKLIGGTALTRTGSTLGTIAYMSPEQAQGGSVDEKTDIWSLGVVLWQMLSGTLPFRGDYEQATIYQIVNQEPTGMAELRQNYDEVVVELVAQCLNKSVDERPSAEEVKDILHGLASSTGESKSRPRSARAKNRGRTRIASLGAAAGVILLAILLFMRNLEIGGGERDIGPVALLPVSFVGQDSTGSHIAVGIQRILTDELVRLSLGGKLATPVAPFADLVEYDISDAIDARRILGAESAISMTMEDIDGPYKVAIVHRRAEPGGQRIDSTAFVATNLRFAYARALEQIARMLGGSDDVAPLVSSTYDPVAFDSYVVATGLMSFKDSGAVERSIEMLSEAVSAEPTFQEAGSRLSEAYSLRTEATKDVSWFARTDSLAGRNDWFERSADALSARAASMQSVDSLSGARSLLEEAVAFDSLHVQSRISLASLAEAEGDFDRAEQLYRQLIGLQPRYWRPYMRLGVFLYGQSRYREAAEAFKEVTRLAPLNDRGYASLGAMYYFMGNLDDAADVFLGAPEPSSALYSNLATLYFVSGDYRKATEWYEKALALDSSDWTLWSNLSSAYYWLPDEHERYTESVTEAMKRVKVALDDDPDNIELQVHMAGFHSQLGDTLESQGYLEVLDDPDDESITAPLAFAVAVAWEGIGFREKALDWMETVLALGYSRTEIDTYPGIEDLRRDPRYQAIVAQADDFESSD